MRLAILTNRFPPRPDGVGDYSFHLAGELQRRGHEVSVLCRREAHPEQCALTKPAVASVAAWDWRAIRPLRLFLAEQQPDWLLVQYVPDSFQRWAMPLWLPVLLWYVGRRGVRVSVTFHEVGIRRRRWPLRQAVVSTVQVVIAQWLTRQAHAVVTSIDRYAEQLRAYTRNSVHQIPIGSNVTPIAVTAAERRQIRQWLTRNDGPLLSTFGRRNQDLFLRALDQLAQLLPDVSAVIVGELLISDSLRPLYERMANRLHVTGYLPEADVYRHLVASDAFFIPDPVTTNGAGGSSNKSASLAAGIAAGLPVVGIRGDMNNALLHQIPGLYLVDATNLNQVVQQLFTLLTDGERFHRQPYIRRFYDEQLSWTATVDRYTEALGWPQTIVYDLTTT